MKKILVVTVNYACENETLLYAKMFEKFTNKDEIALYIVDNKESEGSTLQQDLSKLNCDVVYLKAPENLGYLNGCLYGVDKFYDSNGYIPDWVVVSNTDISYDNEKFYERFLQNNYDDDVWCIGPSVYNSRGMYSNPHYKERLPISHVDRCIKIFSNKHLAKIYFKLSQLKSRLKKTRSIKQESQYVYSNHGCFFILKKDFLQKLGDEKYGVLLYSEESFVAEFILQNNKKAYYDSTLEVIHSENVVTGKVDITKKSKYISESMTYIKRRFYE